MNSLFGTDGIRGIAGREPLNAPTLRALAASLAEIIQEEPGPHRIIIGRDTRRSGGWIERLLKSQLTQSGIAVASARVVSTPAIAHITREWRFSAGIVVSASHNPSHHNGLKLFSRHGTKLIDDLERRIEARVVALAPHFSDEAFQSHLPLSDLLVDESKFTWGYLARLRDSLGIDLAGLRLVVDCAHGANWRLAPRLFKDLGARGSILGAWPDGTNINEECGALHPEAMSRAVRDTEADAGVSFDGDGDRVIMADEQGNILDGDHLLYLFARFLRTKGTNQTIIGTVMSNLGLEVALKKIGWNLFRAPVGDRFVYESMLEEESHIGGEQSGHIILRRFADTGDGLLTALQVLGIMRREKRTLSELMSGFKKFPQVLVNVHVDDKTPFGQLDGYQSLIDRAQSALGVESRIVVRYSGTEPLARVMIEGLDQESIQREAQRIADALKSLLA